MRKIAVIAGLLAMLLVAGCASDGAQKVIAEVNGDKITQQEYDNRIKLISSSYKIQQRSSGSTQEVTIDDSILPQIRETAYNQLIMMKLIDQEAKARGIQLSDADQDKQLADFKAMQESTGGASAYDQVLKDFEITEPELKQELAVGLLRSRVENNIAEENQVTEEQAQQFYQSNQDTYKEPAGMKISHILVDTEEKAQDIIKQLQGGADFAELARQKSSCPSSSRGGDLGVVNQDTPMVAEFLNAALSLSAGQITAQPVKSEFGYHIIKATGQQAERIIPFDEARSEIIETLRSQAVSTYLDQLYQQAEIKDLREK
jgi:parvulin-like peptidyl-prolyl isomerase